MKLWNFQKRDVKAIKKAFETHNWVLYTLPTGAGKTVVFCHLLREWVAQGLRVCVLVNTRHLIDQTSAALADVPHGIIQGGNKADPSFPVQIATVQSLARRESLNDFDLYIVDEAHHTPAKTWQTILKGARRVLGLTATPFRNDGKGLGEAGFQALVCGPGIATLTPEFLSAAVLYGPPPGAPRVNMRGAKREHGDFAAREIEKRVNKNTITGCAVKHYKEKAGGRRALVYCRTRKHARDVAAAFTKAKIPTAYLDGTMSDPLRRAVLDDLRSGRTLVVVSCELIGEGLDVPAVGCVILLRPTQSLAVLMQHVGRGLRRSPDEAVVVLDHVGNFARNDWYPTDAMEYSLENRCRRMVGTRTHSLRECSACGRISGDGSPTCGACGRETSEPVQVDGSLVAINRKKIPRLCEQKYRGRTRFFVTVNGQNIPLGSLRARAEYCLNWACGIWKMEGYLWPQDNIELRSWFLIPEKRDTRKPHEVPKIKHYSRGAVNDFYVHISGHKITLGQDRLLAENALNKALKQWKRMNNNWPNDKYTLESWFGKHCLKLSGVLQPNGKTNYKTYASGCTFYLGVDKEKAENAILRAIAKFEKNGNKWPKSRAAIRKWLGLRPERNTREPTLRTITTKDGYKYFSVIIKRLPIHLGKRRSKAIEALDKAISNWKLSDYIWPESETELRSWFGLCPKRQKKEKA